MIDQNNRRSLFDQARLLPMKPNAWEVLLVSPEEHEAAVGELLDELKAAEVPSRRLRVGDNKESWVQQMGNPPSDVLILDGFDGWTERDWREADYLRSQLSRRGAQVWALAPSAADNLVRHAPTIASIMG